MTDPNVTQAAAARALGIDPTTLKRHARRLGVWRVEWRAHPAHRAGTRIAEQVEAHRTRARATYVRLRREHPTASRTELRELAPVDLDWLRRFDREWLEPRQPARRRGVSRGTHADWGARDEAVRREIDGAVARILELPRPVRLTRTRILRSMGRPDLSVQLWRLPQTRAHLRAVAETADAFANRKLEWAAARCRVDGAVLTPFALMRRARLDRADRTRLADRARDLSAALTLDVPWAAAA